MAKFTGSLVSYPARVTIVWFAALILFGTCLLSMPISHAKSDAPVSVLDALFTATSAACVTGLAVRSTPHDFSSFGQGVILGLIQLGGIGIITVTTFVMLQFGGKQSLRQKAVIASTLGGESYDLRWVVRNVLLFTVMVEGLGFVVLGVRNLLCNNTPWSQSLWEAFFHSISAFCNAGFALHDDSLVQYKSDVVTNVVIMGLIVLGGIGYPVVLDVWRRFTDKNVERWEAYTLHTKLMLLGTGWLLISGMAMILLLEWNHGLKGMPLGTKLLVSAFQSVVPRTAGYQSVDLSTFHDATLFLILMLMLIGAGPCSTAGGFKVSTMMVLVCNAWSRLRGHQRVTLFRRSLSDEIIERATATALIFTVVSVVAIIALLIFEPNSEGQFLSGAFEVASALGTVGLSVDTSGKQFGFTAYLNPGGKIIIIILMYLGRLGPLTAFVALSRTERKSVVEYPKDDVLIG
jgi:trk system potassium uptake protein TrkH